MNLEWKEKNKSGIKLWEAKPIASIAFYIFEKEDNSFISHCSHGKKYKRIRVISNSKPSLSEAKSFCEKHFNKIYK